MTILPLPRTPSELAAQRDIFNYSNTKGYEQGCKDTQKRWIEIVRDVFNELENLEEAGSGGMSSEVLRRIWNDIVVPEGSFVICNTPALREKELFGLDENEKGYEKIIELCKFVGLGKDVEKLAATIYRHSRPPYERLFFEDVDVDTMVAACVCLACRTNGIVPPKGKIQERHKEAMDKIGDVVRRLALLCGQPEGILYERQKNDDDGLCEDVESMTLGKDKEPRMTGDQGTLNENICGDSIHEHE